MKNLTYENFYVDLDHPRALIRDVEEITDNDKSTNNLSYCPIISFHNLRNTDSKITFNRDPCLKRLRQLKEIYGINYILTCSGDRNYDTNVKAETDYCNIGRIEFNLEFSKLRDLSTVVKKKMVDDILETYNRLKNENITLLIHKANGEMKNTIILYSLLRLSGEKKEESIEIIRCLKNGSKKSIGDFNIEFIEREIIQKFLKCSLNK